MAVGLAEFLVPDSVQVCDPAWFASQVLRHPLRLQQLLAALEETFTYDAASAGLLLHAAAPDGGSVYSLETGVAKGTPAPKGSLAQPPVTMLPRMPVGLQLITTTRTYEAVAAVCRAAARVAAAADASRADEGRAALWSLLDGCLGNLRWVLETAPQQGTGKRRRGSAAGKGTSASGEQAQSSQPWQLRAAACVSVLAELLLGAGSRWQQEEQQQQLQQTVTANGAAAAAAAGSSPVSRELELLASAAAAELVQERVWNLPTSAAPTPPGSADLARGGLPTLPSPLPAASGSGLSAQQLGFNALLLRAAAECCGTAARVLERRFATSGRLLQTVLLPLLQKLGKMGGRGVRAARSPPPALMP